MSLLTPLALDATLAVAHHLLVFTLVAVLAAELVLLAEPLDAARLRRLGRLDAGYGALAAAVVVVGLVRAVFGAKGWGFYAGNPLFWAKLAVFAAIGALSIVPTVRVARWRRASLVPDAAAQRNTRAWVLGEVLLLPALPLLAVLMARGIGS